MFRESPGYAVTEVDEPAASLSLQPELTFSRLDDEPGPGVSESLDMTPEVPLLLVSPEPGKEELPTFDTAFPAGDEFVLKNAGPGESAPLRPVTPAGGQQQTPSKASQDNAKFNVPNFVYENQVITASAESEPSDIYEVQPGDNYWKISRRVYGTARYFSALALYNRNRIRDPKKLRPGMKVLLPTIEILEKKYPTLFRDLALRERKPHGYFVQSDGTAAYRIGERDTLSQIARKHLGRSTRWIQIYQLNRSVLTNPNRLKPGTVIILPDDATDVHMVP